MCNVIFAVPRETIRFNNIEAKKMKIKSRCRSIIHIIVRKIENKLRHRLFENSLTIAIDKSFYV